MAGLGFYQTLTEMDYTHAHIEGSFWPSKPSSGLGSSLAGDHVSLSSESQLMSDCVSLVTYYSMVNTPVL